MRLVIAVLVVLLAGVLYGLGQSDRSALDALIDQLKTNYLWIHVLSIVGLVLLAEALIVRRREERPKSEGPEPEEPAKAVKEETGQVRTDVRLGGQQRSLLAVQADLEAEQRRRAELEAQLRELRSAVERKAKEARTDAAQARSAALLLGLLQERGRLIDFLMDDIKGFADAEVGAAARVVHQGCRSVVDEFFKVAPIYPGREGEHCTLEGGYEARSYRLLGRFGDKPPYSGTVVHAGWKAESVNLPRLAESAQELPPFVLAPAEIEVG